MYSWSSESLSPALLLTVVTPLTYLFWRKLRSRAPLPPGPKGYPVIGNLYDIPHERAWLKYVEWGDQYGDVIHTNVLGTHTIVLNSFQAAVDLLEKRSGNYSDRPDMVMANELMEWEWDFLHMRHTEWWRRHRKMVHQYFNQPRAAPAYRDVQLRATGNLLQKLLDSPDRFMSHIRHHSGSIILKIVYGYNIQPENDYYVELVHESLSGGIGMAIHAGTFLVDYLPFLKYVPEWFPGAEFKKIARKAAIASKKVKNNPFETVQKAMADGSAVPSFVTENLEKMESSGEDTNEYEEIIKNCAALAFIGMFTLSCSRYDGFDDFNMDAGYGSLPRCFSHAQAELDSVVGKYRLPEFQDRESLLYLDAMISESLRWYPVTPLSVPHRATSEDMYKGYYIPKGATVIPNVWAILRDETLYPEPGKFKPERFLKQVGKELPPDPAAAGAFGFGRRICPGRFLALNTNWITIASTLACFNISKPIGLDGKPFDPPIEYTDGLVVHPKPFPIKLVPRSPEAINLVQISNKE